MKLEKLTKKLQSSKLFRKWFAHFLTKHKVEIITHFDTFHHNRPNIWQYLFEFFNDENKVSKALLGIARFTTKNNLNNIIGLTDAWVVNDVLYIKTVTPGLFIGKAGSTFDALKLELNDIVSDIVLIEDKGALATYRACLRVIE